MVPRRYVVEREQAITYLQFGAASDIEINVDNTINPSFVDPSNITLQMHGTSYISDTSFDPNKLVSSDNFGISPANTTLHVVTRINTLGMVNARVGTLSVVGETNFEFVNAMDLNQNKMAAVRTSLEITNEDPIVGDVSLPDAIELKRRILDTFATQGRAVTVKDYESMVYSMPTTFGAIKRCRVLRDHDSMKRNLNMYIISEDTNELLIEANDTLKENLKTWLLKNKMINDTVDILDAKIINLGIDFEAVGRVDMSKYEINVAASSALKAHFERHPEIGEYFSITDIYQVLKNVEGVVDVTNVNVTLKRGGNYSDVKFDLDANVSPDGRYINIPKNCITEIRNLNDDIKGVIK